MTKPSIIYMGTPEFAVAPLEKLLEAGYPVCAVVTVPDKPSGRGLKINQSEVKKYALSKGLPLLQPVSLKDPEFLRALAFFKADLFIVVAFRMLPKVVWEMPPMGTFNLHGSLLPQYRGAAPINWAVINGEEQSGVTTFMIDEKIDTGQILLQTGCTLEPEETAGSLHDKLTALGASLVLETVKGLEERRLVPASQEKFFQTEQTIRPAPKLTKELCRIDWSLDALRINRLVRGLSPYPAATAVFSNGEKMQDLKIYSAGLIPGNKPANNPADISSDRFQPVSEGNAVNISGGNRENSPGTMQGNFRESGISAKCFHRNAATSYNEKQAAGQIISDNKTFVHVICGDGGRLSLEEVQLADKKRMKIKDFLAGFRDIAAYWFV